MINVRKYLLISVLIAILGLLTSLIFLTTGAVAFVAGKFLSGKLSLPKKWGVDFQKMVEFAFCLTLVVGLAATIGLQEVWPIIVSFAFCIGYFQLIDKEAPYSGHINTEKEDL